MKLYAMMTVLSLTGCAQMSDAGNATATNEMAAGNPGPKIVWKDGPENSVYFVEHTDQGSYARRCWKLADGYDCLNASGFGVIPTLYEIFRFKSKSLPVYRYDTSVYATAGYGCKMTDRNIITENVSAEQGTIRENLFTLDRQVSGEPLTSEQVGQMFRDNKVNPNAPYFNCPAVASAIAETDDVGTITTTAVSHGDQMQ